MSSVRLPYLQACSIVWNIFQCVCIRAIYMCVCGEKFKWQECRAGNSVRALGCAIYPPLLSPLLQICSKQEIKNASQTPLAKCPCPMPFPQPYYAIHTRVITHRRRSAHFGHTVWCWKGASGQSADSHDSQDSQDSQEPQQSCVPYVSALQQ